MGRLAEKKVRTDGWPHGGLSATRDTGFDPKQSREPGKSMEQWPRGILCCQGNGIAHFTPLLGKGHAAFMQQTVGCPTHLEPSGTSLVTGCSQECSQSHRSV